MKAQDGNMIQEVFHKALALPESQRNAFVAKACTGNPDLEREVKELLRAHDSCAGFLGSPVVKLDFLPENLAGITIDGRYRVACTLESASRAARAGFTSKLLFDDYQPRDQYHVVEKYLGAPEQIGRAALFLVGAHEIPREVISEHAADPR